MSNLSRNLDVDLDLDVVLDRLFQVAESKKSRPRPSTGPRLWFAGMVGMMRIALGIEGWGKQALGLCLLP